MVEKHNIRSINFVDETISLKRGYFLEFCEELASRGWDIEWQSPTRVTSIDAMHALQKNEMKADLSRKKLVAECIIALLLSMLAGYGAKSIQLLRLDPELLSFYRPLFCAIGWTIGGSLVFAAWVACRASVSVFLGNDMYWVEMKGV